MANTDPSEVQQQLWRGWHGKVAFDVGARRGESIQDILDCGFTGITCFEPSPEAFPDLESLVRETRIAEAHQVAISDHNGTVDLYVTAAMRKGELVSPIDGMEWSATDWSNTPSISVPCITLDTWTILNGIPDFIKVDTEGHEGRVLNGARTLIQAYSPGWLIEFHSPTNHRYCSFLLQQHGYEVETIRHPHYAPESHMWYQHGWIRAEKRTVKS